MSMKTDKQVNEEAAKQLERMAKRSDLTEESKARSIAAAKRLKSGR